MQYYAVNSSPSLSHHGILGMKWGIRRFENPDGTLTPEGKRRYGSSENFRNSDYYKKYQAKNTSKVETSGNQKLSQEEIAAKNRKATAKVAGVALGITAAVSVIGYMAARHSVDKKAVDAGKDIVNRINIDRIKIDRFEPEKFDYEKIIPNYVKPDSYVDKAKKAASTIKKTASNMNSSRSSFDSASLDLDNITSEMLRKMRK